MAPECILTPDQIDARSDLYSVGCVAYFLLTGTDVFPAQTVAEVCGRHASMPPEPPSQRLRDVTAGGSAAIVRADLEKVILRCLAKSPQDRPADARELSEALARCEDGRRWADADAAAWWKQHRARVRAHRESRAPVSGMASTIAVDIASRV
jgi:serine/threonine-protein kinase